MALPKLSHLQALVLHAIGDGVRSTVVSNTVYQTSGVPGKAIRKKLTGISGPAFYQLMGRMEIAGLVKGNYRKEIRDRQVIRERFYMATAKGKNNLLNVQLFYEGLV